MISMECLLSYVEFAQYRREVITNLIARQILNVNELKELPKLPFILPTTVPKSSIVYSRPFDPHDDMKDFKQQIKRKAFRLFHKYIAIGAEYEINISSKLRREYVNLMGNIDTFLLDSTTPKELLVIFDACCSEMIYILTDAFRRFTTTTQFLKLSDLIFVKNDVLVPLEDNAPDLIE